MPVEQISTQKLSPEQEAALRTDLTDRTTVAIDIQFQEAHGVANSIDSFLSGGPIYKRAAADRVELGQRREKLVASIASTAIHVLVAKPKLEHDYDRAHYAATEAKPYIDKAHGKLARVTPGRKQKNLDKAEAVIAMAEREYDKDPLRPQMGIDRMAYEKRGGKIVKPKSLTERLQDGELEWLKNIGTSGDDQSLESLHRKYGSDNVITTNAMVIPAGHSTGLPLGMRNQFGAYLDIAKHAKSIPEAQK